MSWRKPERGLVINYSYLWARETDSGREEGQKNRPCAIILASYADPTGIRVRVLPITHTPPEDPAEAIEIPGITKKRLGLDADRSWVILNEVNDFVWPGHDVRPIGKTGSPYYGPLPPDFYLAIVGKLRSIRMRVTKRT